MSRCATTGRMDIAVGEDIAGFATQWVVRDFVTPGRNVDPLLRHPELILGFATLVDVLVNVDPLLRHPEGPWQR